MILWIEVCSGNKCPAGIAYKGADNSEVCLSILCFTHSYVKKKEFTVALRRPTFRKQIQGRDCHGCLRTGQVQSYGEFQNTKTERSAD